MEKYQHMKYEDKVDDGDFGINLVMYGGLITFKTILKEYKGRNHPKKGRYFIYIRISPSSDQEYHILLEDKVAVVVSRYYAKGDYIMITGKLDSHPHRHLSRIVAKEISFPLSFHAKKVQEELARIKSEEVTIEELLEEENEDV